MKLLGKGVVRGDRYNGSKKMMRVMAMNGYALHGKEGKVGLAKGGDKYLINNI